MITISEHDAVFTQVVRFDVEQNEQGPLISALVAEVELWVSRLPGFISSTFHASIDGKHVINYAQWQTKGAFDQFLADPRGKDLGNAVKRVNPSLKPHPIQCRVVRSLTRRI